MTEAGAELFAGRYELGKAIGRGSVSTVHRARDRVTGEEVALKLLDPHLTWDPGARERLRREAIVSRRVSHPGVARVHDLVIDGVRAAVVQEVIRGESVAVILERDGPLPVARALALAQALLEALAACHERGVVHRDVKPSNVIVTGREEIKLIDFGIARVSLLTTVTQTGAVLGTEGYQAPEVLQGERADLRCDLYGVGLVLFEMLAGRPPFASATGKIELLRKIHEPPPRVSSLRSEVPEALDRLVAALLERHPERRPAGAWEAIEALAAAPGAPVAVGAGSVECRSCGTTSRSPIPFCPRCGLFKRVPLRRGDWYVRLRGVERQREYGEQLRLLFPQAFSSRALQLVAEGRAPSAILARGIDRKAAEALAVDARRFGAAVELGRGGGGMQLGEGVNGGTVALGLGGMLLASLGVHTWVGKLEMTDWVGDNPTAFAVVMLAATAAFLPILLLKGSRPILTRTVGAGGRTEAERAAGPLASRVLAIAEGPFVQDTAAAIDDWWSLGERAAQHGLYDAVKDELERALDAVLVLAERGAALHRLLSARDPAEAARDLERVRARRRTGASGGEHALEGALEEEVLAREEADQLLSAAAGRVVLAVGVFRRAARALDAAAPRQRVATEMANLLASADLDLQSIERAIAELAPKNVVNNHLR